MGVPALFRWLSKKYPKIVTPVVEEPPRVINGVQFPADYSNPNPNGELDNLYLDMNGIVHPCYHPEDKPAPESESEMMLEIFKYTDRVVSMARPRKVLMIAVDGVAPRAKMNQQRSRRFRSAQEARIKKEANDRAVEEMAARGQIIDDSIKGRRTWDTNSITPGTPFMDILAASLRYWATYKLNTDPGWANLNIIISDASVPGEGEHKIMEFIRSQRSSPRYNPNTSHAIYGLDADLIMLGLATHEPHFRVLREDVFAQEGHRKFCDLCRRPGHRPHECPGNALVNRSSADNNISSTENENKKPFIWLHVGILREYLEAELMVPHLPFKFDLERALDDWVFMCFFVGNDFLPHLPTLDVRDEGIDILIQIWKSKLSEMGGFMTQDGKVNLARTEILLRTLGTKEDDILRRKRQQDLRIEDREKRRQVEQEQRKAAAASGNHRLDDGYYNQIANMPVSVAPPPQPRQTPSNTNTATKRYKKAKEPTAPIDNIPLYTTSGEAVGPNKMTNSELVANRNKITMANLANKSAAAVLRSKLAASKKPQSKPAPNDNTKVQNNDIIHNSEETHKDPIVSSIPRKRKLADKKSPDSNSSNEKDEIGTPIKQHTEVSNPTKSEIPSPPSHKESTETEIKAKIASEENQEPAQARSHKKPRKEDNESKQTEIKPENSVEMVTEPVSKGQSNHKADVGSEEQETSKSSEGHVKKEEEEALPAVDKVQQEEKDKDENKSSGEAILVDSKTAEAKIPVPEAKVGIKQELSIKSEKVNNVDEKPQEQEQSEEKVHPARRKASLGISDILNPSDDAVKEADVKMDINEPKHENVESDQKPSELFAEKEDVKPLINTAEPLEEKPSIEAQDTIQDKSSTEPEKQTNACSSESGKTASKVEKNTAPGSGTETEEEMKSASELGSVIDTSSEKRGEKKTTPETKVLDKESVTLKAEAAAPDHASAIDGDKMDLDDNEEQKVLGTSPMEARPKNESHNNTPADTENNSGIDKEKEEEEEEEEEEEKADEEFEEMDEDEEEEIEQEIADLSSIRLWEPGYRERYYEQKFHVPKEEVDDIRRKVVSSYIEGICWVLLYYYQGCPSWTWFYPYHYAPFAADCTDLSDINVKFDQGKPFKPYEQLMGVLPADSSANLPKPFEPLMSDPKSEIIDFYPMDFKIDMNGKKMAWQGIALLPFIDEKRLLDAVSKVYPTLTDDERRRNAFGSEVVLISDNHPNAKKLLENFYSEGPDKQTEDKFALKRTSVGLLGYVTPDTAYGPEKATPFPPGGDAMPTIRKNHALSLVYSMPESKSVNKSMLLNGCILPSKVLNEVDLENVKNGGRSGQRVDQRNGHRFQTNQNSGYAGYNRKGNPTHFGYNQYQNQDYHSGGSIYANNTSYPAPHGQPMWGQTTNSSFSHPPAQSFGQWGSVTGGGGNAPPPFQPWGGPPTAGNSTYAPPPPPSMAPFAPTWRPSNLPPHNGAGGNIPPASGSQYPFNNQNPTGQFPGWQNK